ncbi:MAG: MFS transporter [Gaiellaceae bacterium]
MDEEAAPAPYRWVILGAGTLAQTTFAALSVGLPAIAPALRSHYHLSLGETGVVLGAVGIGMLLTLLGWGLLADRAGERAVVAVGLVGAGAATAAAAATSTYPALVGTLVAAGALGASVNAASGRAVMRWFDAGQLGLALGIRQTAIPIGGAAAAGTLPLLTSAGGTGLAFAVLGGACTAGGVVALVLLREGPAPPAAPSGNGVKAIRDRGMWLLSCGSALFLSAQIAVTGFLVLFLHQHRGVSTHAAAGVLAGINVLGIVVRIVVGRWSDRVRSRLGPLRAIGLGLAASTALVAALVDAPLVALVPALVLSGVLGLAWNGISFTAAAEAWGAARSGAALGFQQTVLAVLIAAAPPAIARAAADGSWRIAFALAALGPLLGVGALLAVRDVGVTAGGRTRGTSAIPPAAR